MRYHTLMVRTGDSNTAIYRFLLVLAESLLKLLFRIKKA
jgi:hypothetical protein